MVKVINASYEILGNPNYVSIYRKIEEAARICYKSEPCHKLDDLGTFISRLVGSGHHSVIEHVAISVKIICDRGISHELVRHRLASYSQESTRYVNYKKGLTVIKPCFRADDLSYFLWLQAMQSAEDAYINLINNGVTTQEARSVLPNSLKTEIIMTANLREWRHVFKLRCSKAAHPQMREIMIPLRDEMTLMLPAIFKGENNDL